MYDKLHYIYYKYNYKVTVKDIKYIKYLLKKGLKRRNKYYNLLPTIGYCTKKLKVL